MAVKTSRVPNAKNSAPKYDLFIQLLLVVITATIATVPFIFDSFTVSKLLVLAIGLTYISIQFYRVEGRSENHKIPKALTLLICLFLFSIFISWFLSDVPLTRGLIGQFGRGNGVLYYFFAILILTFSAKTFKSSNGLQIHKLITILSWFLAGYAALQRVGIDFAKLDTKGISPVVLTFGNSNFAGGMLSVLFAYQFTYLIISRTFSASQILLILSLLISSTFAAAVQGYLIILFSIALGFTIILIRKYHANWVRRSLIVVWGLGILFLIMGVFGKFIFAQVFSRSSFQIRIEYWKIGINVIRDFPLFGVGPDRLYDFSSNYMAPGTLKIITATRLDNAHNWYLNFGANFGLISLVILLAIFGWGFLIAARLLNNLTTVNASGLSSAVAFIAMFVDGLVSIEQPGIGIWLYLFAGVVIGTDLSHKTSNLKQESIVKRETNGTSLALKANYVILSTLLFLSSLVLCNRVVLDGLLRSNVQTALLNKGTPQTFSSIESLSVKLRSEPEYAAQSLKPLAAIGDGAKLDEVSKAFYSFSPNSIQATLIRADVLAALNRVPESCTLRSKIIKNSLWDIDELGKYIDCYLDGFDYPDFESDLKKAANYFSAIDRSVIPRDRNEVAQINTRLNIASIQARVLQLVGDHESATNLQNYGNSLLIRLAELQSSNPNLKLENQINHYRKFLDFS